MNRPLYDQVDRFVDHVNSDGCPDCAEDVEVREVLTDLDGGYIAVIRHVAETECETRKVWQ